MSVIYIAIPVALLLGLAAALAFAISARNGQFDDLETPPMRMLYDDFEAGEKKQQADSNQSP